MSFHDWPPPGRPRGAKSALVGWLAGCATHLVVLQPRLAAGLLVVAPQRSDMFSAGAPPPEKNIGRISSQFDNKCDVSTLKWFPGVVRPVMERSCQAAACAR